MGLFDSIRRVVGGGQSTTDEEPADADGDPELVDTRERDIEALRTRAEAVAGEVEQLDFSLASLDQFDAAIEAGYDETIATPDDPETYAWDVFRFGCYLGEVLVRVYDGEWTRDPGWGVTITGPDDSVTVSVFEVARRSIQTEAVFAAVTERAATEVGLDGEVDPTAVPAVPEEPTTDTADDETTAAADADAGTAETTADAVTVDAEEDETPTVDEDTVADEAAADPTADEDTVDETAADSTTDTETPDSTTDAETPDSTTDEGIAATFDDTPADDDTDEEGESGDTAVGTVPSGPDDVGTSDETGFEFGPSGSASDEGTAETPDGDETDAAEADETAGDDGEPLDTQRHAEISDADSPDAGEAASTDDTLAETDESSPTDEPSTGDTDRAAGDETATSTETEYTNPFEAATTQTSTETSDDAATGTATPGDDGESTSEPATDTDDVEMLVDEAEPDRPASTDSGTDDGGSLFDDDASSADADERDAAAEESTTTDELTAAEEPTAADEPADPTAGDGLRATYAEEAEGFVDFWNEHDLDYSPESLSRLDGLVAAEWDDERFADATYGSEETFDDRAFTSVVTELGSYLGEVLVRELDAEWSDETANDGVVVEGPDGPLAIPVFRVAGTSLKQQPVFERSYESLLSDLDA